MGSSHTEVLSRASRSSRARSCSPTACCAATNLRGIFLDGPLTASVSGGGVPGYRTRIDLEGEVTIDAVVEAFNLPYGELLAGQTDWQGTLLLPAAAGAQSLPPQITVASNLSGVSLRFPAPFAKAPGEPTNLELNLTFPVGALAMTATSARRAVSPPISTRRRALRGRSSFAARRSSSAAHWRSFVRSAA